jgi:DNA polymerase-3 subunit alpha
MSDHPLTEVLRLARRAPDARAIVEIAQLENQHVGSSVRLLAMVSGVRHLVTKTNKGMAVAVFEDLSGRVDVVLFPDVFDRHGSALLDGAILDVRGRLERRGESLQIVCESLAADLPTAEAFPEEPEDVFVRFGAAEDPWSEIRTMQEVDQILQRHEGLHPVILEVPATAGSVWRLRCRTRRVEWSPELEQVLLQVQGVLGAERLAPRQTRIAS